MRRRCSVFLWFYLLLLGSFSLHAQSATDSENAQEAFATSIAKAHARSSLFSVDTKPFAIQAKITSRLALRATGEATYLFRRVDAEHWERKVQLSDFEQLEMRNDSGHSWIWQSESFEPLRVIQLLYFVIFHLPNTTTAEEYSVKQQSTIGEQGEPLTCYLAEKPTPRDGYPRRYRWCFESNTGLLREEDIPLNLHIAFNNYIAFQGKQEYTEVRITSGHLPIMDMQVSYAPLDPHALDQLTPTAAMKRSKSAKATPNPEEKKNGLQEYKAIAELPAGTTEEDAKRSVQVEFLTGEDDKPLDAAIEQAPTEAMAEAALKSATQDRITPYKVDGAPAVNRFYQSIWFQKGLDHRSDLFSIHSDPTSVPSFTARSGIYRNEDPAFIFRYPGDFQQIPVGQINDNLHRAHGNSEYFGTDPHGSCQTEIFQAQRLRSGYKQPEVIALTGLNPSCIFTLFTTAQLENLVNNAAHGLTAKWKEVTISRLIQYKVEGTPFAVISASGIPPELPSEPLTLVVAAGILHGYPICWTATGPSPDLIKTLALTTLQFGDKQETYLLPAQFAILAK